MKQLVPAQSAVKKIKFERDERIVEAYEAQGEHPNIPELTSAFKLSDSMIRKILVDHGIKPVSKAPKGPKTVREQPASSLLHARVAQVLRAIQGDYDMQHGTNHNVRTIADSLGISAQAYVEIAAGRRDIRLSELEAIAKAANMTLPTLVTFPRVE